MKTIRFAGISERRIFASIPGMSLLTLHGISMAFGGPKVLDDVSVNIEAGDRACITGRHGEGKATLLKIMAGLMEPDSGETLPAPGLRTAYLSQDVPADESGTCREVASKGLDEVSAKGLPPLLSQLGVPSDALFNTLSGGLRRRVKLAAALAGEPGLLLLDEPTNHLDIDSIEWLEGYLARARCACVFVTHDREFLRRTARRVFDLTHGRLAGWNCSYDEFLRRKAELEAEEDRLWQRKEKRLAAEEEWIVHGVTARRARNMGRVEALRRLREEIAGRRAKLGTSRISQGEIAASGQLVAKLDGVSFAYAPGAEPIVNDFSALVLRGERIGLIGPNGAGKTTLLKLILGKLEPTAGSVRLGTRVDATFFDQLRSELDPEKSVAENLADGRDQVTVAGVRRHIYGYLQDFLFTPERARTPVRALSGGEKARLLLAKLFLSPGNLLVMDEPTNDLDVETLELLEEQLIAYPGTLLLVSHDRAFIDHVVTSSFVLTGGGRVHVCPGGYEDWKREEKALRAAERPDEEKPASARAEEKPAATKAARGKLGFNEKRELARLPGEIKALEDEIAAIETDLSTGSLFLTDPAKAAAESTRLPLARAELETKLERWMELEELQ